MTGIHAASGSADIVEHTIIENARGIIMSHHAHGIATIVDLFGWIQVGIKMDSRNSAAIALRGHFVRTASKNAATESVRRNVGDGNITANAITVSISQ